MFNPRPPMSQLPGWMPTGSVTSSDPRGLIPGDPGYGTPPPSSTATADPDVARWDQYVQQIQQLIREQAGSTNRLAREQLQAQLADAEKGRQNAMAIARLNAETSRYGVDVGAQNLMKQLREQARQFDARHDLEQRQFGLDYAKTATEYLATPDRHFRAGNYLNMASRVFANQPGIAPYGANGTPTPRTEQDFAILTRGGNPYASTTPAAGQPDPMVAAAAGGGTGADARIKALRAVIDASPPSAGGGYNDNDFAALRAAQAIYGMNLNPQQQASLNADPALKAMHQDAGRVLGHDVDAWEAYQRRTLPGQASVRAA